MQDRQTDRETETERVKEREREKTGDRDEDGVGRREMVANLFSGAYTFNPFVWS